MAASAVQLCARALVKLGARPIASFDEATAESEVCATLYPGIRDALVSAHPWSFATAQARLARLVAHAPVFDKGNVCRCNCGRHSVVSSSIQEIHYAATMALNTPRMVSGLLT